jgi:uncharacterized protein YuzE
MTHNTQRVPAPKVQAVKLKADSLYIDLCETQRREVSEGVVLNSYEDDNLVGVDIDNATKARSIEDRYESFPKAAGRIVNEIFPTSAASTYHHIYH